MYCNIYQLLRLPDEEWTDADLLSDHPLFLSNSNYVDDIKGEERDAAIKEFTKWLKKEELGNVDSGVIRFSPAASCGRHFADRYARFHHLTLNLARVTEGIYLLCFDKIRGMVSDLMKALVDENDDYVCLDVNQLIPMDEFLRTVDPETPYYFGAVCKYHGGM